MLGRKDQRYLRTQPDDLPGDQRYAGDYITSNPTRIDGYILTFKGNGVFYPRQTHHGISADNGSLRSKPPAVDSDHKRITTHHFCDTQWQVLHSGRVQVAHGLVSCKRYFGRN